jgi:histidinol dehydrogenase
MRALVPGVADVRDSVSEIIEQVRAGGDAAVLELTRRFDTAGTAPPPLRVGRSELEAALAGLDGELRGALELALSNVGAVARAALTEETELRLPQGQRIRLRELPVRRAAIYAPGGRAPYPSTVIMGAAAAREAGVGEVLVCSPPGPGGELHPAVLAGCALCEVDVVLRIGGAQAVAALAYGTETVPRVDVIAGPGSLYVQEAKRQVSGDVGIDGFYGPSDLVVIVDTGEPGILDAVALDLLAQAEHGPESLVVAVSPSAEVLATLSDRIEALTPSPPPSGLGAVVEVVDLDGALAFAEAFAPEHLQLVGDGPETLAPRVRTAGCVLVGAAGGTAFSDYVAGSNHILPTGGAARFSSALSPRHFRRRMAEVHLGGAAAELAPAGAAVARAEGFELHARSMEARAPGVRENRSP